jgi:hypothetical protein
MAVHKIFIRYNNLISTNINISIIIYLFNLEEEVEIRLPHYG